MPALADEVEVDVAEGGGEAVGVVLLVLDPVAPGHEQAVVHRAGDVGAHAGPHPLGLVGEVEELAVLEPDPDRVGHRTHDPDAQPAGFEVLAEQVVGLLVTTLDEGGDGAPDLGAGSGGHERSPCEGAGEKRSVRRRTAPRGMATQAGRLRASYTTS